MAEAALLPAEDRNELLVDDLHDLLRRVQRLVHLVTKGAIAHLRREVLDDGQRHVGVKKRAPNLAHSAVNVGRRETALRAEVAEGLSKTVRQGAESSHGAASLRERTRELAPPQRCDL